MKKLLLLVFVSTLGLILQAQNEKIIQDKNAEVRNVKGFHGIHVSSGIDLYLTQTNDEAVAISASDPDVRQRIKTVVEDGFLKIYLEDRGMHWGWHDMKLKAYVSFKNLDDLNASGGSDIYPESNLKVTASGGSDLHGFDLTADNCRISASGGSDARITVNKELNVDASGGSDIYYKGSGVIKELRTSGSSSISKKGS